MLPNINISESLEEEQGIVFKVVNILTDNYYTLDVNKYVQSEFCKIIIRDKTITRTHYFKDWKETSISKLVQDERIKQLRR